jgi:hypothetical protein
MGKAGRSRLAGRRWPGRALLGALSLGLLVRPEVALTQQQAETTQPPRPPGERKDDTEDIPKPGDKSEPPPPAQLKRFQGERKWG